MRSRIAPRAVIGSGAALGAVAAGILLALGGAGEPAPDPAAEPIRFGRDIRPILSDRCYACHGPDRAKQKAELRLDSFEAATAARPHGAAIVPGDPDASGLMRRIEHADPEKRMPPADSGKHALGDAERALLRRWIAQGAPYERHWSFVAPQATEPPAVRAADWAAGPIDRFVLAQLERRGIAPSPAADRATLCRRLFLDLTGLPPEPPELQAFLDDAAPDAYERLVDRLLTQEPYRSRYAERMAVPWLDVARYADTCGIHQDNGRQMWLFRDWVIEAFRTNMPYDRFVVEQLAGDLVPGATVQQRIASGFNRAHVTSDEGGAIDDEYLLEYAVDRTSTLGAAFLGLTLQCARCHDHKFDPVTQEDFYGLLAFFNSVEQPGIYSQTQDSNRAYEPFIEVPTPQQQERMGVLAAQATKLREQRQEMPPQERAEYDAFRARLGSQEVRWAPLQVTGAASDGGATMTPQPDGSVLVSGTNPADDEQTIVLRTDAQDLRLLALEAMADPSLPGGRVGRAANGNAILEAIEVEAVSVADPTRRAPVELVWAWADIEQGDGDYRVANALARDGRVWAVDAHRQGGGRAALFLAREPFGFPGGTDLRVKLIYRSPYAQHSFGRVRLHAAAASDAFVASLPPGTSNWYIVGPFPAATGAEAYDRTFGPETLAALNLAQVFGSKEAGEFTWRFAPGVKEAEPVGLAQGVDAEFVAREIVAAAPGTLELSLGSDDGIQVFVNGARVHERRIDRAVAADQEQVQVPLRVGRNLLVCKVVNTGGNGGFYHRQLPRDADLPRDAVVLALPEGSARPEAAAAAVDAWRGARSPRYRELTEQLAAAERERTELAARSPRTMVMKERPMPVPTFVMKRGVYDQPDKARPVTRAIPRELGELPADAPRDRLGLAQWLVGPQNPLTSRVVINRLWEQFFGRGIVRTSEDFGLQGEWPSHPELLDWMAVDFRTHGWDLQRMVRQIVLSSTYRQSSRVRPEVAAADPDDRLLAWYPRQRLAAEQIRDQALFIAGLLHEQVGGPSVKPYQPEGLWQETSMPSSNTRMYTQGTGEDLWRRSLYTYWKRASPPPSMLVLDAPTREFCAVRRFNTNTPLQALVLWNDPQFVEAARVAAERALREPGDDRARLAALWTRATAAPLRDAQREALEASLAAERARWRAPGAADEARKLLAVGAHPAAADLDPGELAAWTMLANAVLSSDSVIVKR
ncbi:MAG: PSD1 and planctomycete cytochrome C domain-containing protein [Phycisphaerales bacterium]